MSLELHDVRLLLFLATAYGMDDKLSASCSRDARRGERDAMPFLRFCQQQAIGAGRTLRQEAAAEAHIEMVLLGAGSVKDETCKLLNIM
jgi:hypothetical protein